MVFLRNDIFELLVKQTPDKGKDSVIVLDYDDSEIFKEIVLSRFKTSTGMTGSFADLWTALFDTHVGTQDSFHFILDRTLMRPRDLLNYLRMSVDVAINRGHSRVTEDDIRKAEETYSNDTLLAVSFEIKDVFPMVTEPLYGFINCPTRLDIQQVFKILKETGFFDKDLDRVLRLIVWFCFLGIQSDGQEAPMFMYQARQNLDKMLAPIKQGRASFVIHPAFRKALECREPVLPNLFNPNNP